MSAGRFGAKPGVLRSLGLDQPRRESSLGQAQVAHCGICKSTLTFSTGTFGQTLEACSSPRCPNRFPHHPKAAQFGPIAVMGLMVATGIFGALAGAFMTVIYLFRVLESVDDL